MARMSMKARKARKSKKTKRGGSRKLTKLVPWGLVLANQLFSKMKSGRSTRRRSFRRKSTRRRR